MEIWNQDGLLIRLTLFSPLVCLIAVDFPFSLFTLLALSLFPHSHRLLQDPPKNIDCFLLIHKLTNSSPLTIRRTRNQYSKWSNGGNSWANRMWQDHVGEHYTRGIEHRKGHYRYSWPNCVHCSGRMEIWGVKETEAERRRRRRRMIISCGN